ncbi:hypothetical protein [Capnocytophaga stomatis]|uniref:hypothetical protein n=1 Tax=Capnocytophaga stomatis TaxID=1848904 RepID=UPI0012FF6AC7|nr:hypothetical protein [Capnocytophaga stomatis]
MFIENFFLAKYNDNGGIDQYFEELKEREQAGSFMHLDCLFQSLFILPTNAMQSYL